MYQTQSFCTKMINLETALKKRENIAELATTLIWRLFQLPNNNTRNSEIKGSDACLTTDILDNNTA